LDKFKTKIFKNAPNILVASVFQSFGVSELENRERIFKLLVFWFSGVVTVKTWLLEPNYRTVEQQKYYVNTYVDISTDFSVHHLNKYLS